ncbi:MAG: hypothetical protein BGN97_11150 [Microbacterium sp. 69-10]|uniref:hypothetical protein n=1 Tax=Microbacterium sp. 69-10 TaxID=1895783 RepID=UPI00095EF777|nr:hypothetical protein [Microbacterium sp. 69-10]OJU40394.1 MAG: hypothetical protein BGN97_11150 [Microbacterium sp. 69-10]
MTILAGHTDAPTRARTRASIANHRTSFEASIERELRHGATLGMSLPSRLWDVLNVLVEREISHPGATNELKLLEAVPIFGLLRGPRFERRLTRLLRSGLVRRERTTLRPTVAGIAAVRPIASLPGSQRPSQELLRELRRGEIGRI